MKSLALLLPFALCGCVVGTIAETAVDVASLPVKVVSAGVDAATERAILDVLERTKEAGRTLVVVHHDLATAAEYFDSLLLLKQRLFAQGTPDRVLHPELLSEVYEGKLRIFSQLAGESLPGSDEANHG